MSAPQPGATTPGPTPSGANGARLLHHRPFLLFFSARVASRMAVQIATVALGWQVYAMTNSAFALGMIGLAQFLPTAILVFLAGAAADRYERRRLLQICQIVQGCAAAYLAFGAYGGWLTVHMLYGAVTVFGIASAFEAPASAALLPATAPPGQVQRATAMTTGGFQLAVICGPAIGGFAYALAPGFPYVLMALLWVVASFLNAAIHVDRPEGGRPSGRLDELFAGVRFVRANRPILGTISLDLFAVLLGGATALMPIFARDVLHTGPWGLGALRGAPAIGALAMTVLLARTSINRRVGMRMFQAVIVFGIGTVVFALSRSMALSLVALAVMGAADTVSVVIRTSLVQLRTPDDMRGRVGAVNYLFINASNQLGEFESGVVAALIGAVPAAVVGGFGTIAVALLWMAIFPDLRKVERLE